MKSARKPTKNPKNNENTSHFVYLTSGQSLPKSKDFEVFEKLSGWKRDILINFMYSETASIGASADTIEIDRTTVAVALKTDKYFRKCYNVARKVVDEVELMKLEEVSTSQALERKSTVERIFRLKSLNRERYADRGKVAGNVDINITFGNGVNTYGNDTTTIKEIKTNNNVNNDATPSPVASDIASIVNKID